jgi:hypothetical protein
MGCCAGGIAARLPAMILPPMLFLVGPWLVTLAAGVSRLEAQSEESPETPSEYTVKAAYLFQFGRYVQWPRHAFADGEAPLVIGILGKDPFGRVFDEVARTKRIDGRPVVIQRFASMADYKPCHILFVAASVGPANTTAVIEKLKKSPVLLVGEEPKFAEQGGAINFFVDEDKVRIEVNVEATRREELKISSTLLSVAKIVGR